MDYFGRIVEGPIEIARLKQVACSWFADSRLCLLFSSGIRGSCLTLEPDQYLCSCLYPSKVDLRIVSVCTGDHGSNFLNSLHLAALLGREVQKANE